MKAPRSSQSKVSRVKKGKKLHGEILCSDNFSSLISTKTGLHAARLSLLLALPCIFFSSGWTPWKGVHSACLVSPSFSSGNREQWHFSFAVLLASLLLHPTGCEGREAAAWGYPRGWQCLWIAEVGGQRLWHPALQLAHTVRWNPAWNLPSLLPLVTVMPFWGGHWEKRWSGPSAGPKCDVQHEGWWRMLSPRVLLLLSSALCCVCTPVEEAGRLVFTYVVHQPALLPPHQKCTLLPWVSSSLGLWKAKGTDCLSPSPSWFITALWNRYGFPILA